MENIKNMPRQKTKINREIKRTISSICIEALMCDGDMHKQWYIERILIELGWDLKKLKAGWEKNGYSWEEGIAP